MKVALIIISYKIQNICGYKKAVDRIGKYVSTHFNEVDVKKNSKDVAAKKSGEEVVVKKSDKEVVVKKNGKKVAAKKNGKEVAAKNNVIKAVGFLIGSLGDNLIPEDRKNPPEEGEDKKEKYFVGLKM